MIRFNRNDSLINSDLLPPTGDFMFTFNNNSFPVAQLVEQGASNANIWVRFPGKAKADKM